MSTAKIKSKNEIFKQEIRHIEKIKNYRLDICGERGTINTYNKIVLKHGKVHVHMNTKEHNGENSLQRDQD